MGGVGGVRARVEDLRAQSAQWSADRPATALSDARAFLAQPVSIRFRYPSPIPRVMSSFSAKSDVS